MTEEQLSELISCLDSLRTEISHKKLNYLIDDLLFYREKFKDFPKNLHMAWTYVISNGLNSIFSLPEFQDEKFNEARKFCLCDFRQYHGDYIHKIEYILFSQNTCKTHFALHEHKHKTSFPFFGTAITQVAENLKKNPDLLDDLCIRVMCYPIAGGFQWVALNNRGLAALYMADLFPTRLRPDLPTADEKKRLFEKPSRVNISAGASKSDSELGNIYRHFKKLVQKEEAAPYCIIHGINAGETFFSVRAMSAAYLQNHNLTSTEAAVSTIKYIK